MDTSTILLIAIPVIVVLAGIVMFTSLRRRDGEGLGHLSRETRQRDAGSAADGAPASDEARELERSVALERVGGGLVAPEPEPPVVWTPPDPEEVGVSRRMFLNRSAITLMAFSLSVFGATNIAFLWPRPSGGFGSKVKIGKRSDIDEVIESATEAPNFSYFSEAQTYLQPFPLDSATQSAAAEVYSSSLMPGIEAGLIACWQKCPHLGCKVPSCASSQWFECPCHGSQYNRVGEKKAGPAPRGLDHFPIAFDGEDVIVDTGTVVQGPPIGTDTTGQGLEGPHCA